MVSPRRVRDVDQLLSFVDLRDRLCCHLDRSTTTDALNQIEKENSAVNYTRFICSQSHVFIHNMEEKREI
jgi:hypothetical protein